MTPSSPNVNGLALDFDAQTLCVKLAELQPDHEYQVFVHIGGTRKAPITHIVRGGQTIRIGHISCFGMDIAISAHDLTEPKSPIKPCGLEIENIPKPHIDEDLAIVLARNNVNYLAMTGMQDHRLSEVVLYAAYLRDPRHFEDFSPRGSKYAREVFDAIG